MSEPTSVPAAQSTTERDALLAAPLPAPELDGELQGKRPSRIAPLITGAIIAVAAFVGGMGTYMAFATPSGPSAPDGSVVNGPMTEFKCGPGGPGGGGLKQEGGATAVPIPR